VAVAAANTRSIRVPVMLVPLIRLAPVLLLVLSARPAPASASAAARTQSDAAAIERLRTADTQG